MSQIIEGTNTLVRLPGRSVTRRDDGLLELSCSYACKTSAAGTFRSLFEIGKKVPGETDFIVTYNFTETKREDGFTEFSVTSTGAADPDDPNVLTKKGERAVQHFPSGLVRVDQTYTCPTAQEAKFRQELNEGLILPYDDGTPAIDGLYIFPRPNEIRNADGFTEFKVSAYGRTNTGGYTRREFVRGETSVSRISTTVIDGVSTRTEQENTIRTLNESVVQTFVQLAEQPFLLDIGIERDSLKVYLSDGRLLTDAYPSKFETFGGTSYSQTTSGTFAVFGGTSTSNFGRWAEITITYNAQGFVSIVSYLAR